MTKVAIPKKDTIVRALMIASLNFVPSDAPASSSGL
jgi:hypothetical protein